MQASMLDIGNNFNEKLVDLVRQHKMLYDSSAEGYSNFHLQDEIWRKIGAELDEDVAACKLKWKNIRSCYTRYLRQASTQKRTYYLAKQLAFLLPFCKPRQHSNEVFVNYDESNNTFLHYEDQDLEQITKSEPLDEDATSAKLETNNIDGDEDSTHTTEVEEINVTKRKRWDTCCEYRDDPDINFLKSLIPDIRKMNGRQKNKLKITILKAIDEILYKDM